MNIDKLNSSKDIKIKFKGEEMTAYTLARWLSVMEGIEVVEQNAKKMGIDLNNYKQWVKPLAFQKYINERTYGMIADVLVNEKKTMD